MIKYQSNMEKRIVLNLLPVTLALVFFFARANAQSPEPQKDFNNPKPASASVYNLGLKSYEQGDTESAITFFKKAVELDPDFVDAYFNLGAIYKKQKKYFYAIEALQKAIQLNPDDIEITYELGSCYLEEKKYPEAKKYFSLVTTDYPKYNEAKQNLEKIETYLALDITPPEARPEVIQAPEVQGQLLVDALEKSVIIPEAGKNPEQKLAAEPQKNPPQQGELLINTLTKPLGKGEIKEKFKIISDNFSGPAGIAKDSKNNLYIANFTKDSIEKISPEGKKEVFAENVGLKGPVGIAVDENDNLFVANYSGNSIVKITPEKSVSVLIDRLEKPYYVFYDSTSNKLYATIQGNGSLIEIDTKNVSKQPITSR